VGGDISLKISEPGLTVMAFKYPVTLMNKKINSYLNESKFLGVGQQLGSIGLERPNSGSFSNKKQDYQSKFSNELNGKHFEYIKLIGNNRALSDPLITFL
jgi:hypothetical protein